MHALVCERKLLENEVALYELLRDCLDATSDRPPTPSFLFALTSPPCIVMEDLSPRTRTVGLSQGLSFEQARAAVVALARLHRIRPGDLEATGGGRAVELVRALSNKRERGGSALCRIYEDTLPALRAAVEELGDERWEALRALAGRLDGVLEGLGEGMGLHLSHGDCWAANLLYDVDEPDKLVAMLDFQFGGFTRCVRATILVWAQHATAREHVATHLVLATAPPLRVSCRSPMLDVLMLLASSCDAVVRREQRAALFEAYLEALGACGKREMARRMEEAHLWVLAMQPCLC
jgi:hypothetical protein